MLLIHSSHSKTRLLFVAANYVIVLECDVRFNNVGLFQGLAGELVNVLREAGQTVTADLMKFGTHVKKKVNIIKRLKVV